MVAELGNTKAGEEVTLADTKETRGEYREKVFLPNTTPHQEGWRHKCDHQGCCKRGRSS